MKKLIFISGSALIITLTLSLFFYFSRHLNIGSPGVDVGTKPVLSDPDKTFYLDSWEWNDINDIDDAHVGIHDKIKTSLVKAAMDAANLEGKNLCDPKIPVSVYVKTIDMLYSNKINSKIPLNTMLQAVAKSAARTAANQAK